jgi:hypothetical protein
MRRDGRGAVLVLEAPSREDAAKAMATLPLIEHGFATFEAIELTPFAPLEGLFAKE